MVKIRRSLIGSQHSPITVEQLIYYHQILYRQVTNELDNDPYRQIEVENVRKEYYDNAQDVFMPSGELLDVYRKLGMGGILHDKLNFEQTLKNIEELK